MALLEHQLPAVAACAKHFRTRQTVKWLDMDIHPPIVVNASVSSGKSVMIAELAKSVKDAALSKGKPVTVYVLVIQRQGELCDQNSQAAWDIGLSNSVYSASCGGRKSTHYSVVYATEGTLARALDNYKFSPYTNEEQSFSIERKAQLGKFYPDLILIDESHQVPFDDCETQYIKIIRHFYQCKPHLRVAGFTGSPFRDTQSIIGTTSEHFWRSFACIEPGEDGYPAGGVGNGIISTEFMIEQGWVVQPVFGFPDSSETEYDFSHLSPNGWEYDEAELDEATSDRETCLAICADVIDKARNRKGVLLFAATQRHARMISAAFKMLGVSEDEVGVITDKTSTKDRRKIIEDAKTGAVKYTINVNVLTTGVNVPWWDTLVFMRPIGSLVLLIQAIGRVLRLLILDGDVPMIERSARYGMTAEDRLALIAASQKPDALIMDYAGVMETLGHLYDNPVLEQADLQKAKKGNLDLIECPDCHTMNSPHARRCIGKPQQHLGIMDRCEHFWSFRECPSCGTKNDQVARECRNSTCRRMLIDPNANLVRKHYTDAELVPVRAMKIESGKGGKITIRYELSDGRMPVEIFWPSAGQQKSLNTRIWKGFVNRLPIDQKDKYRLGSMKADTIMQNMGLIPVPLELCARQNKKGKWLIGNIKWSNVESGEVA